MSVEDNHQVKLSQASNYVLLSQRSDKDSNANNYCNNIAVRKEVVIFHLKLKTPLALMINHYHFIFVNQLCILPKLAPIKVVVEKILIVFV